MIVTQSLKKEEKEVDPSRVGQKKIAFLLESYFFVRAEARPARHRTTEKN
jgi:hypothetical protein